MGVLVAVAPSSSPPLLRAVVFLVAGVVLLAAAAMTARGAVQFLQASQTAPGVVTRLLAGGGHPEIGFTTRDGRPVTFPQGGLIGGYRMGQSVRVRYLSANPTGSACVDRWPAIWGWTILLGGLGCVFGWGGLASAFEAIRR